MPRYRSNASSRRQAPSCKLIDIRPNLYTSGYSSRGLSDKRTPAPASENLIRRRSSFSRMSVYYASCSLQCRIYDACLLLCLLGRAAFSLISYGHFKFLPIIMVTSRFLSSHGLRLLSCCLLFIPSIAQDNCNTQGNPYCAGDGRFAGICCPSPSVCYFKDRLMTPACCEAGQVCINQASNQPAEMADAQRSSQMAIWSRATLLPVGLMVWQLL
jgi:hypothetical protein